ncbi:LysR family transcriptional regulator [Marinactinospora thermotolerans]|uniref:LysR family transcriptional regulator n=1 Tax=Marinactinospora thermotolerans TaxID=531310 RepID=UPI00099A65C8|nr:LysR family transcriptional regulator [Marinactinospora thermotolerans]
MDLVGACKAFVSVSERGSFTLGAAAARIPQPVASRRIAALERHLGGRLFDRSTRRATLTPFGREMLASAKRLVELAEAMEHDAERARLTPIRFAVPDTCPTRDLAFLDAEARRQGLHLDFVPAAPARRAELLAFGQVRAALVAVPADDGYWRVPLGLASAAPPRVETVHLETLRAGRADPVVRRRVWLQPEDDVPHIRDRLFRIRDAVGLQPAQVAVAPALTSAVADVLGSADLLLCSPAQAEELGLHWRPIGGVRLVRGFDVSAGTGEDAERVRLPLTEEIARCLGVPADSATPADQGEAQ